MDINNSILTGEFHLKYNEELAGYYNSKGVACAKVGKIDDADYFFEKARRLNPAEVKIILNLAEMCRRKNEAGKAIAYYRLALILDAENQEAKIRLTQLYILLKRYDEAFETDPENDNIIKQILAAIVKYAGECQRCGKCCKQMQLSVKGKVIRSEEEFDQICQKDPSFKRWIPSGKNAAGIPYFNCRYLNAEGLCSDYENRQQLCRRFPDFPSVLKPECGYRVLLDLQPYQIKSLALLNKMIAYVMERKSYPDAANKLKHDEEKLDEPCLAVAE